MTECERLIHIEKTKPQQQKKVTSEKENPPSTDTTADTALQPGPSGVTNPPVRAESPTPKADLTAMIKQIWLST
jgi:hypothetical protein